MAILEKIKFLDQIQSITLPQNTDPDHNGDTVYLAGWGSTFGTGTIKSITHFFN